MPPPESRLHSDSKPSSPPATGSGFCSRLSCRRPNPPAMPAHRTISSMKMMQARFSCPARTKVAHAAGAYPTNISTSPNRRWKRTARWLAGDGARQQRFACRSPPAAPFECARPASGIFAARAEFDDLLQFFLGLFHARHVLERDLLLLVNAARRGSCQVSAFYRRSASAAS